MLVRGEVLLYGWRIHPIVLYRTGDLLLPGEKEENI
jgi:hypothetical protein